MLNFLENHDEQRFASSFYAGDPWRVTPSLVVATMMGRGPMMVYFGQELGESGMDAEGYSGTDGRTTIFDYWSVASVRRWLGKSSSTGAITAGQKKLREHYRRILNIANAEKAVSLGAFFDLMYVNYDNASVDPHRHYTFLRATADELLAIAVNFSDSDANMQVDVPLHAFNTLDFPQGDYADCRELLSAPAPPSVSPPTHHWKSTFPPTVPPCGNYSAARPLPCDVPRGPAPNPDSPIPDQTTTSSIFPTMDTSLSTFKIFSGSQIEVWPRKSAKNSA